MYGYIHPTVARRNAGVKKSAGKCAAAVAVDDAKGIVKWCDKKGSKAEERCATAKERHSQGKKKYRGKPVAEAVALWCSIAGQVEQTKTGEFTPATPAEMAEDLYWDKDALSTETDLIVDTEESKMNLLLPLAAGTLALGIIGFGIWTTR